MMLSPKILILSHGRKPAVSVIEPIMVSLGYKVHLVRHGFGDALPQNPDIFAGLIILGGSHGVYEAGNVPWLQEEIDWINTYLKLNRPVFGICLGCQILAHLYGANVHRGQQGREFAFTSIKAVEEDAIFQPSELESCEVFQAHGDTFSLPENTKLLMSGKNYKHQAIKFKENIYGTQFHPEGGISEILRWYKEEFIVRENYPKQAAHIKKFPENFPTFKTYKSMSSEKLFPVHKWLEGFLGRLFKKV